MTTYEPPHQANLNNSVVVIISGQEPGSMPGFNTMFYCTNTDVDRECTTLSVAMNLFKISVFYMGKLKAEYHNGERVKLIDFRETYLNELSDEDYQHSKILCSKTHTWI